MKLHLDLQKASHHCSTGPAAIIAVQVVSLAARHLNVIVTDNIKLEGIDWEVTGAHVASADR